MSEEVNPDVIQKTQKKLGKHISKPSLTEKLLRKPPFRFLHDITTSVIKDTGFLKGLYSETELISDNVKDRESKIAFLTKLIEATKTITGIELVVRPSKIIAGLEPTETNKLLQAIGTALDKKLDSSLYVKTIKTTSKKNLKPKTTKSSEENKPSTRSKVRGAQKVEKPTKKESTPRKHDKFEEKNKKKSKKDEEAKELQKMESSRNEVSEVKSKTSVLPKENILLGNLDNTEQDLKNENKGKENKSEKDDKSETIESNNTVLDINEEAMPKFEGRSDRPKSAKPQTTNNKNEEIILINEDTTDKNDIPVRPRSSLRPPSVRPSSARPGAPRLRPDSALPFHESVPFGKINVIVENYSTKEMDEEETVVVETPEADPEPQSVQKILDIPAEKGHLVEQILEQIHDDDVSEHAKSKVELVQEGFRNRDATTREINQLRATIQALTKVANPLGKLMTYLHEDVEAMHSELNMWINMKKQIYMEIDKQKRLNEKSSEPLKIQLNDLIENIKSQGDEICNARSNILRNEIRINELLTK